MKIYCLSVIFDGVRVGDFILDTTWPEYISKNNIEMERVMIREINKQDNHYVAEMYFTDLDPEDAKDVLLAGVEEYYVKTLWPLINEEKIVTLANIKRGMKDKKILISGEKSNSEWEKVMG